MEINGRIWGSLPLAVKSGMDFPGRMADLYLAELLARNGRAGHVLPGRRPIAQPRPGGDLDRLRASGQAGSPACPCARRRDALSAALSLAYPRGGFDVFSRDDPRPGLARLPGSRRKLLRKARA